MLMWQTAYTSEEYAAGREQGDGPLAAIGNAELVSAISDSLSICRMAHDAEPSVATYEDLIRATQRMADGYHWLGQDDAGELLAALRPIRQSAELILGEFEKVQTSRSQAQALMSEAQATQHELLSAVRPQDWQALSEFVDSLFGLRGQGGHPITLRDIRYVDRQQVDEMEHAVIEAFDDLGASTVPFLLERDALAEYRTEVEAQVQAIEDAGRASELESVGASIADIGSGLELLNEILGTLNVADAIDRTAMIEAVSEVYAHLNRAKALLEARAQSVGASESRAEFAAQFSLLPQAVTSALGQCDSPDRTDEALNRVLVQIEELEGKFGSFDEFVETLSVKRKEIYEAFEARKQLLLEQLLWARRVPTEITYARAVDRLCRKILENLTQVAAALQIASGINEVQLRRQLPDDSGCDLKSNQDPHQDSNQARDPSPINRERGAVENRLAQWAEQLHNAREWLGDDEAALTALVETSAGIATMRTLDAEPESMKDLLADMEQLADQAHMDNSGGGQT
jgi:hypothetical protein